MRFDFTVWDFLAILLGGDGVDNLPTFGLSVCGGSSRLVKKPSLSSTGSLLLFIQFEFGFYSTYRWCSKTSSKFKVEVMDHHY